MTVCPQCGGTYPDEVGFCPMDGARLHDASEGSAQPRLDGEGRVGEVLDRRYRLDQLIGEGAMAYVYRATHTLIGKALAIKVLRPEHVRDAEVVRRFLQEARLASSVKHPNVVDISDYGELENGGAYYVMEYLRGRTLAARLHAGGAMRPVEAMAIALQICHGLEAAHEQNIVHRDLKPENVFLQGKESDSEQDARVKLLDFGIARVGPRRMTAAGAVLGTPSYMAPEQARGADVDQRSDLYALGMILFEMLVGWVPFRTDDIAEVLNKQIHQIPPRIGEVKPELADLSATADLVADLLAKSPDARPPTAAAVRERLSKALERDFVDGSRVRLLKSTLAMGSGMVEGTSAVRAAEQRGKVLKEAPIEWGRTERPGAAGAAPSSLVASPGRKDRSASRPRAPSGIDPTPMAESRPRGPHLGVVLLVTSLLAAGTTLAVYSLLVGFPTSAASAEAEAPAASDVPPPAPPGSGSAHAIGDPHPPPARPARVGADPPESTEAPPEPQPDHPTAPPTSDADGGSAAPGSVPTTARTREMDPKSVPPRSNPRRPANKRRRDSSQTDAGASRPTKGEKVTDPPPTASPSRPTNPQPPPPPPPPEAPEPADLKDPFDAN